MKQIENDVKQSEIVIKQSKIVFLAKWDTGWY